MQKLNFIKFSEQGQGRFASLEKNLERKILVGGEKSARNDRLLLPLLPMLPMLLLPLLPLMPMLPAMIFIF